MARIITLLGCVPCTMNPPIITLSPVCTKARVEMLPSRAIAVGIDVGVGVAVEVTIAVGVVVVVALAVGLGVGVRVAVGVAVGVGVDVGAGLAVAVGVGVGVGPDCAQYRPPVLSSPQMIISVPVRTAVCPFRPEGALAVFVAIQLSVV